MKRHSFLNFTPFAELVKLDHRDREEREERGDVTQRIASSQRTFHAPGTLGAMPSSLLGSYGSRNQGRIHKQSYANLTKI